MNLAWKDEALDELADVYTVLPLVRQRVLAATVERVEATLRATPLDVGEDRGWAGPGRMRRFWYVVPLRVWYVVSADGVEITSVGKRDDRAAG